MRPDKDDWNACAILKSCDDELVRIQREQGYVAWTARWILHHAIAHLARPDRDIYPKTRRGTKRAPITRTT